MATASSTTRPLRSMPPFSMRGFITVRYALCTGCSPRIRQTFRVPARDGTQTTKGRNCWRCGPTSYGAAGTLWVITRLKGPRPWTYFYLYVIMDVYSRYVVGFMIAYQESQALAKEFIEHTLTKHGILPGQLTLHADRGSAMTSNSVALLLSDLGVAKTHSRPHVSNDNPYSEAQFKTLKYRPEFPERFGTVSGAREVCAALFAWYNGEHHHGGIALLTPATVHYGRAAEVIEARQARLDLAYQAHPQRFVNHPPLHPELPPAVWINPPLPNADPSEADEKAICVT